MLTVGTFDGVHSGHQFIIHELLRYAERYGAIPTVVTFYPHPQIVLADPGKPPIKILTPLDDKLELLAREGVAKVIVIPFTRKFANMSSEEYVERILWETIGMRGIIIGYDHAFGKDRAGGMHTLKQLAQEKDFFVKQLPPHRLGETVVSSTLIRRALAGGDIRRANQYLGRQYAVRGTVIAGEGRGRQLGFPTANVALSHEEQLLPGRGVYAVTTTIAGETFAGMANIGVRPTFELDGNTEIFEIHIHDFAQDIYGEAIHVAFHERLRDEQKFESLENLKNQLDIDRKQSMAFFRG